MKYCFLKELYNKEALFKAAYSYTDHFFVHIDVDEKSYIVTLEGKTEEPAINEQEFQNEILAQMVRQYIRKETKNVRELMLARAFSSTVIEDESMMPETEAYDADISDILTDWFETNG